MISPLIILSMVENAFKHGASGDVDNPLIKIKVSEYNDQVLCEIWNTKSKYKGELNDAYKVGIGLGNIKKQLHLIYPDSHQLTINATDESYEVVLQIFEMETDKVV